MKTKTILLFLTVGLLPTCKKGEDITKDTRAKTDRRESLSPKGSKNETNYRASIRGNNIAENDSVRLLKSLSGDDPRAALKVYFESGDEIDKENLEEFAEVIFHQHPEFVYEWLKNDFPGETNMDLKMRLVTTLSRVVARDNSLAAFTFINQLNGSSFQAIAIQSAFGELGQKDPQRALEEAKSHYKGKILDDAIIGIATGQIQESPENAMKTLQSVSSKSDRIDAIAHLLGDQGLANFERVAPILESMDSKLLCELLSSSKTKTLVSALFENNISIVERSLKDNVVNNGNWEIFALYARKATEMDYAKGVQFLEDMPDSPLKSRITELSFSNLSEKDYGSALEKALALDESLQRSALNGIAMTAGQKGIAEVVSMLSKVSSEVGDAIIHRAVLGVISTEFDQALDYVTSDRYLEAATSPQSKNRVIQAVTNAYTTKDPDAAFQWISTLGEESKVNALEQYAKQKSQTDIEGLAGQLASMPHDEAWRAGVKVLISELRNTDAARAKEWEQALVQEK